MPDEMVLTIPFAKLYSRPPYKRSEKAIFLIRRQVARLAKVSTVKISPSLNELIWERGDSLRKRRVKVRVKVNREEGVAEVEPFEEAPQEPQEPQQAAS